MEQQTVSIAKAGITTTLNARCSVLAAANPASGRYNPFLSAVKNMDLPASLLSRFDMQFLLLDKADAGYDKSLATHIAEVHRLKDQHKRELDFEPFDAVFIRSYVRKARTYEPYIPAELSTEIVNHYADMRTFCIQDYMFLSEIWVYFQVGGKKIFRWMSAEIIPPRVPYSASSVHNKIIKICAVMLSIVILLFGGMSQALARLRFSDTVVQGDFQVLAFVDKFNLFMVHLTTFKSRIIIILSTYSKNYGGFISRKCG